MKNNSPLFVGKLFAGKSILAFAFVVALATIALPTAQAQTFSVVHNFTGGSDGGGPLNGFTFDI